MIRKIGFLAISILLSGLAITLLSFKFSFPGGGLEYDAAQSQKAFALLNKVRHDPNSYSGRFGFSLKGFSPRADLVWDDSLAAVAMRRAISMAYKGYFGHVDPDGYGINYYINQASYSLTDEQLKHKKESNFDAYEGGAPSGEVAIKNILIDYDKIGDEGRNLLLGVGDFNASLTDCGVAYVHGSGSTKYKSYTVVIIAKRGKPKPGNARF
jgi:hypothetical protein